MQSPEPVRSRAIWPAWSPWPEEAGCVTGQAIGIDSGGAAAFSLTRGRADRVPGTSDLELARDVLAQAADRLRKRLTARAGTRRAQRHGTLAWRPVSPGRGSER